MRTTEQIAKMQEAGEYLLCPRCGMATMKAKLHTNALSRMADIYVCDQCGIHEAIDAWMGKPLSVKEWACMQDQKD